MSRGDRGNAIFLDDKDLETFIDTLDEACTKTGWLVHAFVLMGNHYHLPLETPEANLVAGMKWLQGTKTNLKSEMTDPISRNSYISRSVE